MAALGLALGVVLLFPLVFTQETSVVQTFVTNTPVIDPSRDLIFRCNASAHQGVKIEYMRIIHDSTKFFKVITGRTRPTVMVKGDIRIPYSTGGVYDDGSNAFLELTWKNPGLEETGLYECGVWSYDSNDNFIWSSKNLTIS